MLPAAITTRTPAAHALRIASSSSMEPIPRSKLRFMIWAPFFTAKRIACAAFTATGWVLTSKNFTAMISISLTLFAVARIDPASMVP